MYHHRRLALVASALAVAALATTTAATSRPPRVADVAAVSSPLVTAGAGQVEVFPAPPATVAPVTGPTTRHRVRAGEILFAIAARYCGAGSRYRNLAAANRLASPDRIYVGQYLRVDRAACTAPIPRAARASRSTAARTAATATGRAAAVIAFARAQLGEPYRWAAAGPGAWDCSGLVMMAYRQVGIRLPHQSGQMLGYGRAVSRANLRPGDLVWPHAGHVQIYVGGGKIIEAATYGVPVRVRAMYGFWTARRLL